MKKHFVTFLSPGTFVAEDTTKDVDDWDVDKALELAVGIVERHGAKPYGFYFSTRERGEQDFDSKETKRSGMYYIGGKIRTLQEVEAENDPENSILISNMKCNHWDKILVNTNSWKWTQPLKDGDVVLDPTQVKPKPRKILW